MGIPPRGPFYRRYWGRYNRHWERYNRPYTGCGCLYPLLLLILAWWLLSFFFTPLAFWW